MAKTTQSLESPERQSVGNGRRMQLIRINVKKARRYTHLLKKT